MRLHRAILGDESASLEIVQFLEDAHAEVIGGGGSFEAHSLHDVSALHDTFIEVSWTVPEKLQQSILQVIRFSRIQAANLTQFLIISTNKEIL